MGMEGTLSSYFRLLSVCSRPRSKVKIYRMHTSINHQVDSMDICTEAIRHKLISGSKRKKNMIFISCLLFSTLMLGRRSKACHWMRTKEHSGSRKWLPTCGVVEL